MMNKDGFGLVPIFVTATIGILIIVAILIPIVHNMTTTIPTNENVNMSNAFTLTHIPIESGTDVINNGTTVLTRNQNCNGIIGNDSCYKIDYTTGVVTPYNLSVVKPLATATYNYYDSQYLSNGNERVIAGVIVVVVLAGFIFWLLKATNVL